MVKVHKGSLRGRHFGGFCWCKLYGKYGHTINPYHVYLIILFWITICGKENQ